MPQIKKKQPSKKSRGSWEKGQSGNPGGRPKVLKHIRELAQEKGEAAFLKIIDLMASAEDERVQLKAAEIILDRAYGRAPATLEIAGTVEVIDHRAKLLEKLNSISERRKELAAGAAGDDAVH